MAFYIIIFIFCCIMLIVNNVLKEERERRIFEIATLVVLCIISGTRYYLGGTDYSVYERAFNVIPKIMEFDFGTVHEIWGTFGMEKGYLFLCSIIKTIGFNFFGFTLIHSIIFYTCMYIGLKRYTKNFNLLIIVFLYKIFFYNTFISLRQSITIGIFFIAIRFIENRKFIPYFLCCLLALAFHNGAILLFLVYFINYVELTKKRIIILNCIFIPTILISMLNIPIFNVFAGIANVFSGTLGSKIQTVLDSAGENSISLFHTLEYLLMMIIIIVNYDKIIKADKNSQLIIKLFLILLPLFTLFRGYGILIREKDYFVLTYGIILGYLCNIFEKKYIYIIQACTIRNMFIWFCKIHKWF